MVLEDSRSHMMGHITGGKSRVVARGSMGPLVPPHKPNNWFAVCSIRGGTYATIKYLTCVAKGAVVDLSAFQCCDGFLSKSREFWNVSTLLLDAGNKSRRLEWYKKCWWDIQHVPSWQKWVTQLGCLPHWSLNMPLCKVKGKNLAGHNIEWISPLSAFPFHHQIPCLFETWSVSANFFNHPFQDSTQKCCYDLSFLGHRTSRLKKTFYQLSWDPNKTNWN